MINHVNLGLFNAHCWRSEIFEELCIHTHVETEQISRWKTVRYPSMLLFSLVYQQESHAAYISKGILETSAVKHTFSTTFHLNEAQNLHFSRRRSIHHFSSFNLFSIFPSLQSQLLVKQLLSLKRLRRAWGWRGNRHLVMYSTTVLPTNPSQEGASWQPRCLVATPPLCWDALPPSPHMTSVSCRSIARERANQGKEREQHVCWSIILDKILFLLPNVPITLTVSSYLMTTAIF